MNTIAMVIAFAMLAGLLPAALQLVWNATIPDVVGSKRIGYWTAAKLAVLGVLVTLPAACAASLFRAGC
jgi:hypothetical protein